MGPRQMTKNLWHQFHSSQLENFSNEDKLWADRSPFDQVLLALSSALLALAIVLFLSGGLQFLFFPAHKLGHDLLPDFVWANITFLGDTLVALTIAVLFIQKYPKTTLSIFYASVIGTVAIHGFKNLLANPRPPAVLDHSLIEIIGPAIIVGWSRVVCAVHWPVDVCAGAGVGLLCAWAGLKLSDQSKMKMWPYWIITGILLLAPVLLIFEDGGFNSTRPTAVILGVGTLAFWLITLGLQVRHCRTLEQG